MFLRKDAEILFFVKANNNLEHRFKWIKEESSYLITCMKSSQQHHCSCGWPVDVFIFGIECF